MLRAIRGSENHHHYSMPGEDCRGTPGEDVSGNRQAKRVGRALWRTACGRPPERLQSAVHEDADAQPGITAWLEKMSATDG